MALAAAGWLWVLSLLPRSVAYCCVGGAGAAFEPRKLPSNTSADAGLVGQPKFFCGFAGFSVCFDFVILFVVLIFVVFLRVPLDLGCGWIGQRNG